MVGGNFRLDPIQAAVLRIKLRKLESWHRQRRENANRYNLLFNDPVIAGNLPVITPRAVYSGCAGAKDFKRNYHIYNQYVIRVERRDELRDWLQKKEIATEIYYPLGLHQQQCLTRNTTPAPMAHAEKAARETLALPIYPGLSAQMQEYVVKSISEFYR